MDVQGQVELDEEGYVIRKDTTPPPKDVDSDDSWSDDGREFCALCAIPGDDFIKIRCLKHANVNSKRLFLSVFTAVTFQLVTNETFEME